MKLKPSKLLLLSVAGLALLLLPRRSSRKPQNRVADQKNTPQKNHDTP